MYRSLRPLLFLLPPETAHGLAGAWLSLFQRLRGPPALAAPGLRQQLFGLDFPAPVGLAAGMDKGQVAAPAWFALGFGFVEIGTITPRPQKGNPRPRLFRLVRERAVINRMGFNNPGAEIVAARLRRMGRQPGPVLLNIGKNKDTPNERAAEDYLSAFRTLAPHADAVVVNVSSPNTPGLRALQGEVCALLGALVRERGSASTPLLVKLSPDEERVEEIALAAVEAGADGIVATNTTVSRDGVRERPRAMESGGLSGAPLRNLAEQACARIYRAVGARVPIIGVGGIFSAEDAYARIRAGASLVQVYTALVYEGPGVVRKIARGLATLLERDGLTLRAAIGMDARR